MGGNCGNSLCVLLNITGFTPQLTTWHGQLGLRTNKRFKNLIAYYSVPGLEANNTWADPVPFSGSFIFWNFPSNWLGYDYNIIHHTPGTKYTRYHILNVRYGGDFYNLLYLIVHSHKVHIYLLNFTSKTFELLIGC